MTEQGASRITFSATLPNRIRCTCIMERHSLGPGSSKATTCSVNHDSSLRHGRQRVFAGRRRDASDRSSLPIINLLGTTHVDSGSAMATFQKVCKASELPE